MIPQGYFFNVIYVGISSNSTSGNIDESFSYIILYVVWHKLILYSKIN